ncbi:MAG: hypothetical protein AVDCRST_MAG10-1084, partial [uncultured Acidimicrobiales bacterium]
GREQEEAHRPGERGSQLPGLPDAQQGDGAEVQGPRPL